MKSKYSKVVSFTINAISHPRSKQALLLYSGVIFQAVLSFITSVIIARALKPYQYGNYSYLYNLFNLFLLLVTTGHFYSLGMILADRKNELNVGELIGAGLIITTIICCVFATGIYLYSYVQDIYFINKIGASIRLLAPVLLLYPFQVYLENVFMGLNKIYELTLLRIAPKLFYIIAIYIYMFLFNIDYLSALGLLFLTSYIVYVYQIYRMKPIFKKYQENVHFMSIENKRYGFNVYIGSLAGVASTYICTLSIGYYSNNIDLGYYNLAVGITTPLILLPNVIATIYYKDFANIDLIPDKVIKLAIGLSITTYIIFLLVIKNMVVVLYSVDYIQSVPLTYILGLGMIIHGVGDIFNRFLCAKARGKDVRNGAFFVGASNVFFFIIFIPSLQATGAAITRLFAGIIYCGSMYVYYRRSLQDSAIRA